jgi:hypothetical protein
VADDPNQFGPESYANPMVKALVDHIASGAGMVGAAMPEAYGANAPIIDPLAKAVVGTATLPQRFMDNAAQDYLTGTYHPGPYLEAAMLPMGTGAIAGVPMRAGEAVLGAGPIRAYHGSPYDFDAFSMDKIGAGEGAQAYGHGLYFAEQPAVAEEYKNAITQAQLEKYHDELIKNGKASRPTPPVGKMYEVNINADPDHFLDWDKPFKDQHPEVQQKLKEAWLAHPDASSLRSQGASHALKEAGIPGIKYLDQGSRVAGQGSSNYVVFDDKMIDILKKYGIAGLPAAGAAASAVQPSQDDLVSAVRGQ